MVIRTSQSDSTSAVLTLTKKHVNVMENNYQYHIFSPYRVCPLGAHVDHQHGLVTGFAINKGVDLWFNVREDSAVNLSSLSFEGEVHFDLAKRSEVKEKHWGDYARGAKYALKKRFELSHGIDGVLQGSFPVGGLSSSAAVLIAYVMAFAKANGIIDRKSTRLNSSHANISYAVFCLKKNKLRLLHD